MVKLFYKKTGKLTRAEQSAAAYALLTEKLSEHFGVAPAEFEIKKDCKGCPYLVGINGVFVSVSHTDGLVACAFSDNRVGVDAEKVQKRRKSVEKRVFTDCEISLVDRSDEPDSAFFALWTLKESYLKAIGTGFAGNAKDIGFTSLENPVGSDQPGFMFTTEKNDDYVISVCEKTADK